MRPKNRVTIKTSQGRTARVNLFDERLIGPAKKEPGFPQAVAETNSIWATLQAVQKATEVLLRRSGDVLDSAVRIRDLDTLTAFYDDRYSVLTIDTGKTKGEIVPCVGNVWDDANAYCFTGEDALQCNLTIEPGDTIQIAHCDTIYQYFGPTKVCIGSGGDGKYPHYDTLQEDWVPQGSTSHAALDDRELADQHPQSAITNLVSDQGVQDSRLNVLDTRADETDTEQAAQDGRLDSLEAWDADHDAAYNPHNKVTWRFKWEAGTYYPDDMVVDDGWLVVANAVNSDRAAPQQDGDDAFDMPDVPAFVTQQFTGTVQSGRFWDVLETITLKAYQIWVPSLTDDTNYVIRKYIFDTGSLDILSYEEVSEPVLVENSWVTVEVLNQIVLPGTTVGLVISALNSGASTAPGGTPDDWVRGDNSNSADPASGAWNRSNDGSILRIHETSLEPELIDMIGVIAGSTISIVSTVDPNRSVTYRTTTDETYANNVYTWSVAETSTGPLGEPAVGSRCILTFDVPVASATEYVELIGGNPTHTWGVSRGYLGFNDVSQDRPDDAFGVRILADTWTTSPFWDIAGNFSVGSGSSGGGVGPPGADGTIWHSGTVSPPDVAIGVEGDFYIDTVLHQYYGPKTAGSWVGVGPYSLQGPKGDPGDAGYNQIQDSGNNVTQRSVLNFVGNAVEDVSDDGTRTTITLTRSTGLG